MPRPWSRDAMRSSPCQQSADSELLESSRGQHDSRETPRTPHVLLDVLASQPAARRIWTLAEQGDWGFVSAISVNNVYYIVRKAAGRGKP